MSIAFYNLLHIIGIIMLFLGIGGAVIRSFLAQDSPSLEKFGFMSVMPADTLKLKSKYRNDAHGYILHNPALTR